MNEELKKVMKLRNVAFRWQRFIREKESTELWTKEEFLFFLENEDAILNYSIGFDGDKMYYFKDGGSPELKEKYKQKLDRIREIYNERFKPETEEIDLSTSLNTATQKVQFMYELGIFDLLNSIPELNGNATKISQVISAFTGVNYHTIRKPYIAINNDKDTSGYNISNSKNEDALNTVYNEIGLKRKVRIKGDIKGK